MRGCLVVLNETQPVPNSWYSVPTPWVDDTPWTVLKFDNNAVLFDPEGVYDTVTRKRLIIPPSMDGAWAKIKCSVRWESAHPTAKFVQILITRILAGGAVNLSGYASCSPSNQPYIRTTTTDHSSETHPVQLQAGDIFRAEAWHQGDSPNGLSCNIIAGTISLEVL